MYFVYLIRNEENNEIYYGYTNNLERRLEKHNINGKWKLIYYEAYLSEKDAINREKKLKHYGQARSHLKNRLKESLHL